MKNKVILLHPKVFEHDRGDLPLAPLALAGVLEKEGFDPIIVDQSTEGENAKVVIRDNIKDALWVGVSAMSGDQIKYGLQMADYVRAISPETPIVWGGRHCDSMSDQTACDSRVDVVVRGEGERVVVDLSNAYASGSSLENVKGIKFVKDGEIVSSPDQEFIADLNTLPHIPWHRFDLDKYFQGRKIKQISIQTGRGCPYNCSFCSHKVIASETFRRFSAERILENLEPVIDRYNIDRVVLYEPFFITDQNRISAFCEGVLKRGWKIEWTGSARANNFWKLPAELLELMKRSGCRMLTFGFESGSQKTLDYINKKITVEDIKSSVRVCHEYNIMPDACFIVGFPEETMLDVVRTLGIIAEVIHICPALLLHVQIYTTFPGSVLYEECLDKHGLQGLESLEEWGEFSRWKKNRPWLSWWFGYFLKMLNGSIYASDVCYLKKYRKDLKFIVPLHFLTRVIYSVFYRLRKVF
ncbi:B12-binding domain-containing radical SAM protein [Verrucomicrobiota bacterium]